MGKQTRYAEGYQAALRDVFDAFVAGGEGRARQWVLDNLDLPRVTHEPGVRVDDGARYPFRPVCSCGWEWGCGYVADHAARDMAEAHAEGRL